MIIDDDLGLGHVHGDPFNQKLPGLPGRSPDILVVLHSHHARVRENYLDGPADLVVEVLSPSTAGVDRGEKFREYAAGGVPEYWIVDPQRQVAEFYRLAVDSRYQRVSAGGDGRYACASVPGFWIREEWLWSRPPVRDVETALGLR